MLEVICGKANPPQRDWFSYIAQGTPDRIAVCDGTWKLVVLGGSVLDVTLDSKGKPNDPTAVESIELFRLDRDPGEKTDLLAEHPDIAARLLARLQQHRRLKLKGIPDFREGREGFVAPKDWVIRE